MDGMTLELPLFLLATFTGALVAGLTGFAFGLVVSAIWLYILTPLQTATLIIAFGLLVQGYSVWKLRGTLDWPTTRLFMAGGTLGVPVGVDVLTWANPAHVRMGVGAFLGALQSLRAAAAGHPRGESGRRRGRRGCRLPQRRARRHHRTCRNSRDHLVRACAAGRRTCSARCFQPVAVATIRR